MKPNILFDKLGLQPANPGVFCGEWMGGGPLLKSISPIDGKTLASVRTATRGRLRTAPPRAPGRPSPPGKTCPRPNAAKWSASSATPCAPPRPTLGRLVTLETGKILAEGEGEVQEMIDICDFAIGPLPAALRADHRLGAAGHRMLEQWHPLGIVGIVTAFNFPVAVWAWNSALAAVCGDATFWKPSSQTPLCAIATIKIAERVCRANQVDPAIFSLVIGDGATVGEQMAQRPAPSPASPPPAPPKWAAHVAEQVQRRLGRVLLELGGNNAIIVAPSANLELAARAILFGAVGTAGQRCTSTRRLFVHRIH